MTLAAVANSTSTGSHGGGFKVVSSTATDGAAFGTSNPDTALFNGSGHSKSWPSELTDNDHPVLRVGDIYLCPTHGPNPIVTGSVVWTDNDRAIVRQGDHTACGATVTPPVSPEWSSE